MKNTTYIEPKQLLIYLMQPSCNQTRISSWETVSSNWNRTTQYDSLFQEAFPIKSLPFIDKSKKRPVIILHCGPKTGSTTLRLACRHELEKSCVIVSKGIIRPHAYVDSKRFYPMVRSCNKTHYFCAKSITMPIDVPTFNDAYFIHMFPFRNYDDWAKSALKQSYDRGGKTECDKVEKLFFERNCTNSQMEIDFRKYGKTDLSVYKEYVVRRMNEKNENHLILLYYHRELDGTIKFLSETYEIPILDGSDGNHKGNRPNGTCDKILLKKFHECFSWQLTKLT
ncbi:hypothetical protein ACHAXS_007286 [Conticribra weissflogii]